MAVLLSFELEPAEYKASDKTTGVRHLADK
jgi:hypothetical protein